MISADAAVRIARPSRDLAAADPDGYRLVLSTRSWSNA